MTFVFTVAVTLSDPDGPGANLDEVRDLVIAEIDQADPGYVQAANGASYFTSEWSVDDATALLG